MWGLSALEDIFRVSVKGHQNGVLRDIIGESGGRFVKMPMRPFGDYDPAGSNMKCNTV
jgi:hypothetical protein